MPTPSQPEFMITPDTDGCEAIPEPEQLLRALPSVNHERRLRGTNCPSLYDALEIDAAHVELEAARQIGQKAFDDARVRLARAATQLVSGALWFDPGESSRTITWRPLGIGELLADQHTDCYGHTLVLSACLEQQGIEHLIAYANGHAFVVLPTGSRETQSAWIFDAVPKESLDLSSPANPALAQDLSHAIVGQSFKGVPNEVTALGRSKFTLNARELVGKLVRRNETFEDAARRNPWLMGRSRPSPSEQNESDSMLTVRVFEATQGRDVLVRHLAFQRAVGQADFDTAAQLALGLAGRFPDADIRSADLLRGPRVLVRALCDQGKFQLASDVVDAYFSSFDNDQNGLLHLWEGEMRSEITLKLGSQLGLLAMDRGLPTEEDTLYDTVRGAAERALQRAGSRNPALQREVQARLANLDPEN